MSESQFGAYRLLRALGHGGMADVWYAERTLPGGQRVPVALKRIRPMLSDESTAIRMFLAEARLCLRFDHPNIVRTLEAGEVAGQPFIALEMIDGVELRALERETPEPLPIGFAVHVAHEIALALAYAHQLTDDAGQPLGIVHRDVSPSNVMLGFDGSVKLLDFGVAKALRDEELELTRRGVVKGKIGYMAPEVIAGEPYDHRADLFSLGVILHELLTHERLFAGRNGRDALALNRACRVASPSSINREVPSMLDYVTLRALARDPDQRYAWAAELVTHLGTARALWPWTRADTAALVARHAAQTGQRTRVTPALSSAQQSTVTARPRPSRRAIVALCTTALILAFLAPVLGVGLSHRSPDLEDPVHLTSPPPARLPPSTPAPAPAPASASTSTSTPKPEPEPEPGSISYPTPPRRRPHKRPLPLSSPPPVIDRSNLIDPFAE